MRESYACVCVRYGYVCMRCACVCDVCVRVCEVCVRADGTAAFSWNTNTKIHAKTCEKCACV